MDVFDAHSKEHGCIVKNVLKFAEKNLPIGL